MKAIPFVSKIIEKNYNEFDEDRKRNMSVLIIIDILMICVMASWTLISLTLEMPELFWLDVIILIGYLLLLIIIIFLKLSFDIARLFIAMLGFGITGIPVLFYGLDTSIALHLVFLPLTSILLFSKNESKIFLKYFGGLALMFISLIIWDFKYGAMYEVPADTFRIFNLIIALNGMFVSTFFAYFFFSENTQYKVLLDNEREKSDRLLLSLFPEAIAKQLRNSNKSLADSFDNVTVIFADIVGFTQYSTTKTPSKLVEMLDEIFTEFDNLSGKYNIEKIKTIGDAYMAVCGLPKPDPNHCQNIADMALEINQSIKIKFAEKYNLKLRIGIHTGHVVAGVIGNKKFSYDLWGESVNIASRFESGGQPDKIHITEDVKNQLGDAYLFEDCGEIPIKGKGMMKSFFLKGKKSK